MKTQTRRALKQDKFVDTTHSGLEWLQKNRSRTIWISVAVVVVIVAIIAVSVIRHGDASAARAAFGQAMNVYSEPVAEPGQPAPKGEQQFATTADRAKAANQRFMVVARQYAGTQAGRNARYFAGVTAIEMGDTHAAEADLLKVAHSGDKDLASLANLALAGLYRRAGKTEQAVSLYQRLISHPSATVPASAAQLQLASLYELTDPAKASQIYASLKNDKGAAGQIAAQKLGSK